MESPLSIIDAVVIIFIVLSAILAMARGITREVLGVVSFFGAGFVSTYSADAFAPLLTSVIDLYPLANKFSGNVNVIASWLTGGVIFVIMWIIFTIITAKLSRFISDSAVSGVDSMLGFLFGVVRGLFVVGIVYTMYTHFVSPEKYHSTVVKAQLKPVLDKTSKIIVKLADLLLPERIAEGFSKRPEAHYDNSSTDMNGNAINSSEIPSNQTPEDVLKKLQ
jgi:membrane protein required for colicin V production